MEIENIKQQYEFWLNKKQKEAEKFVADFNLYREKKNSTIAEYEAELLKLYDYGTTMKRIVDGIGEGSYQMRKTRRGYIPVVRDLPSGGILDDHNNLGRTLKLVQRKLDAEQHRRNVRNRATVALMSVAEVMEGGGVTALGLDGADVVVGAAGASLRRGSRPSTAPRLRGSGNDIWSAPPAQAFDEDLMTITSQTTRASRASGGEEHSANGAMSERRTNTFLTLQQRSLSMRTSTSRGAWTASGRTT